MSRSRALPALLHLASLLLPRRHRARWREEALALLLDTHGARRLHYTLDTIVKLPALAWQHHRSAERTGWVPTGRAVPALVAIGLLSTGVLAVGAFVLVPLVGEDVAEFMLFAAMVGMAPAVAIRALLRIQGGPALRLPGAAALTVLAGTGPFGAGLLSTAASPVLPGRLVLVQALVASTAPGLWLIWTSWTSGPTMPTALRAVGTVAGAALLPVLGHVQLISRLDAPPPAALHLLAFLALLAFVPAYLIWSAWSGLRLVTGHSELLTQRRATWAKQCGGDGTYDAAAE